MVGVDNLKAAGGPPLPRVHCGRRVREPASGRLAGVSGRLGPWTGSGRSAGQVETRAVETPAPATAT